MEIRGTSQISNSVGAKKSTREYAGYHREERVSVEKGTVARDCKTETIESTCEFCTNLGVARMPRISSFYKNTEDQVICYKRRLDGASKLPKDKSAVNESEAVRQWLLGELTSSYNFPKEWVGERIIFTNEDGASADRKSSYGIRVLTKMGLPFLCAYIADYGHAEVAEQNLRATLHKSITAGLGISTDGTRAGTRFFRRKFDSTECERITDIDIYSEPYYTTGQHAHLFESTDKAAIKSVKPLSKLTKRLESIFFDAHSHIRDIDGLHADEALDELCKVLYTKLLDEEQTSPGQAYRMQECLYGSNEEFAATIRGIYHGVYQERAEDHNENTPDRTPLSNAFSVPIKLSSPALTRVVQTLQDYDLSSSDVDIKGRAFQRVLNPAARAGMGQYLTPDPIIRFLVSVTQPRANDSVLDPFCGSARFLAESFQEVTRQGRSGRHSDKPEFDKLRGIEKSDRMVRVAKTDMRLNGEGHSKIYRADALLEFSNYPDLSANSFDIVLTNPPFGSILSTEALAHLGKFELAKGRRTIPVEVLGLERCLQFLKPGGRLAIILPDGLLTNPQSQFVREWLQTQAKVRAIVSLPIATFAPFGANVKTSILILRSWKRDEDVHVDYPVFLARVDDVGYDAAGRPSSKSGLPEVATRLAEFIKEHEW